MKQNVNMSVLFLVQAIRSTSKADPDDDDDIILKRQSNSIILSAQIPSVEVDGLGTPIEMRFQQNIKVCYKTMCLQNGKKYLDY